MTVGDQRFTCRIELSKNDGIAITIRDMSQPDQVYKQVLLEGDCLTIKSNQQSSSATIEQTHESLKTEVKNDAGSTTIEQGPEDVTVTCKRFRVNAETIELVSKEDTTCTAKGKFNVNSTDDLTLNGDANCRLNSGQEMALAARNDMTLNSEKGLAASAPKVELSADAAFDVQSRGALSANGKVVSIKGDMRAELDAPNTTVGSAMTTVQGQVVSVTGALVKLG